MAGGGGGNKSLSYRIKAAVLDAITTAMGKTFYNRFYFVQAVWTFLLILSLPSDFDKWAWNRDLMAPAHWTILLTSLPAYRFEENIFLALWIVALLLVLSFIFVTAYVARALATASFERLWIANLVRGMLGVIVTLFIPFARIFLAYMDCDYFHDGVSLEAPNRNFPQGNGLICNSDAKLATMWWLSLIFFLVFVALLLVAVTAKSALQFNPRSYSAMARPALLFDLYVYGGLMLLTFFFVTLKELGPLVSISFFLHQLTVYLWCIFLQPYYDSRMNDLRSALFGGTSHVGAVFIALTLVDDNEGADINKLLTSLYYVALCVGLIEGLFLSIFLRRSMIKAALAPYAVYLEEEEAGDDDDKKTKKSKLEELRQLAEFVPDSYPQDFTSLEWSEHGVTMNKIPKIHDKPMWDWLDKRYIPQISMSLAAWIRSMRVELGIRDIVAVKKAKDLDPVRLDIAEHILKVGMMNHPQSQYLQLMYISFMISYVSIDEVADELKQRLIRMEPELTIDLEYASFLLQKRLASVRTTSAKDSAMGIDGGGDNVDPAKLAEVKSKRRTALYNQTQTLRRNKQLWTVLAGKDDSNDLALAHKHKRQVQGCLQSIWETESVADTAFKYCFETMHGGGQASTTGSFIADEYARFLLEVKHDRKSYEKYKALAGSGGDNNSQSHASASRSRSGEAGVGDGTDDAARKEFLLRVGRLRARLRVVTIVLLSSVIVLFVVFQLLKSNYVGVMLSLSESGVRRTLSMKAVESARDMLYYAKKNDNENFVKSSLTMDANMQEYWYIHNNLVNHHMSSYSKHVPFYRDSNPDIKVWRADDTEGAANGYRKSYTLNGADIGWQIVDDARKVGSSDIRMFQGFDKSHPLSFPELYFVLENGLISARVMDTATSNYIFEAEAVAQQMIIILVTLVAISVIAEIVAILLVFRRELQKLQTEMGHELDLLIHRPRTEFQAVLKKLDVLSQNEKRDRGASFEEPKHGKKVGISDSDTGSDSDSEVNEKAKIHEKKEKQKHADKSASDSNGGADQSMELDVDTMLSRDTSARTRVTILYYGCMILIVACMVAMGYTAAMAITAAETRAPEVNGASRRQYLARRIAYLVHELIYQNDPQTTLVGGALTWQNSSDLIRCQLRRSIDTMMSAEYALLYGGELGWKLYPEKENWPNGPVREWGRDGAVDWCSPLTWDEDAYLKSLDTGGSYGRATAKTNDELMLTPNCLTTLPADITSSSLTMTEERITHFSKHFDPPSCNECQGKDCPNCKCKYFMQNDPVASLGLHSYVLYMSQQAREVMEAPPDRLTMDNLNKKNLDKYSTDEWYLGLDKSALVYQHEGLTLMEDTAFIVVILFIIVLIVVLSQYFVLGSQVSAILTNHQGVMSIMRRFSAQSEEMGLQQSDELQANMMKNSIMTNAKGGGSESDAESLEST